jgi:PAS domain S-box-containing protein
MTGHTIQALLPPDRMDEEDMFLNRIRAGERIARQLTRRRHKDGRIIDVAISAALMRSAQGEIFGVSYFVRDAGAFVEQQRLLLESEARFQAMANHMSQLAWIAAADGTMEWCNDRWFAFTGIPAGEMSPSAWRTVIHPDQFEQVAQGFHESVREGTGWEDTFQIRGADGAYRWFLSRAHPVKQEDGRIIRWIGTNTDITEAREREEQVRMLLMEVNHRSKNMLSTVQALVRRSAPGVDGFVARFSERLRSLSINQDILVRREWREVPLAELAAEQLAFVQGAPGELTVAGVSCSLIPRAAEVVGMALHELATNSLKYGAMSAKGGQVDVGWDCTPGCAVFEIWWRERGGPPVAAPTRQGFGTTLMRDVPRHNLGCEVTLDYDPAGLSWSLRCDDRVLASRIGTMKA